MCLGRKKAFCRPVVGDKSEESRALLGGWLLHPYVATEADVYVKQSFAPTTVMRLRYLSEGGDFSAILGEDYYMYGEGSPSSASWCPSALTSGTTPRLCPALHI